MPDANATDLLQTIAALQSKNLLQILAEPNVLAINGHNASFLAGGEFPFPNLQGGGAGLGAVTIQFREFGVRINFTPTITPRGSIRLTVTPEVSSLDFANGLIFSGFTIPALSTRRVSTEIELEEGQTFAIGGLLSAAVILLLPNDSADWLERTGGGQLLMSLPTTAVRFVQLLGAPWFYYGRGWIFPLEDNATTYTTVGLIGLAGFLVAGYFIWDRVRSTRPGELAETVALGMMVGMLGSLALVALGLAAYGVFCAFDARYHRV